MFVKLLLFFCRLKSSHEYIYDLLRDANTLHMQWPYEAAAIAFEAIPRTLAQNCGVNVIRTMTALQGKVETLLFEVDMQSSFICVHLILFIYL